MVLPFVMYSASPAHPDIVARVATKGCTRPYVESSPLISPTRPPSSSPASSAAEKGTPWLRYSQAVNIMVRAITAATDRSMPPIRITTAAPAAMIPTSDTCVTMLLRFRVVRKNGDRNDIAITMTRRPPSGPPSPFNPSRTALSRCRGLSMSGAGACSRASGAEFLPLSMLRMLMIPPRWTGSRRCLPRSCREPACRLRNGEPHDRLRAGIRTVKDATLPTTGHHENPVGQAQHFLELG